jgi:hypothetical protein
MRNSNPRYGQRWSTADGDLGLRWIGGFRYGGCADADSHQSQQSGTIRNTPRFGCHFLAPSFSLGEMALRGIRGILNNIGFLAQRGERASEFCDALDLILERRASLSFMLIIANRAFRSSNHSFLRQAVSLRVGGDNRPKIAQLPVGRQHARCTRRRVFVEQRPGQPHLRTPS